MPLLDTDSAPDKDTQNQDTKTDDKTQAVPEWLATVKDKKLAENETLRRFKDVDSLAASHVELRSKLGANPVSIPDEKAPQEKWDEFYGRLGRPEKPEKYEFSKVEGIEPHAETESAFRVQAHKLGLTQKQADGLNRWVGELAKTHAETGLQAHNKAVEEAELGLKKEWGKDFDGNLVIAQKALHRFGGKDLGERLKAKGLDGDPVVVKFFHALGKATGEDADLKGVGGGGQPRTKTRAQLEQMQKDPRYWSDPTYRATVTKGFEDLYGGQQAAQ